MGKEIQLANDNSLRFPDYHEIKHYGNILIIGNFVGVCGTLGYVNGNKIFMPSKALRNNAGLLIQTIKHKKHIYVMSTQETVDYFLDVLNTAKKQGMFKEFGKGKVICKYFHYCVIDSDADNKTISDCANEKLFKGLGNMKFNTIIQNPPYNKSLHLDFLEKGLDMLDENGRMVIVEPATWLINIRKNGKAKRYDEIKKKINGHIESVKIENLNEEFDTETHALFATTTIDMSKTFDKIKCDVFGEHRTVDSIYDCNIIGQYSTIWSILDKVKSVDCVGNHIWDGVSSNESYITIMDICCSPFAVHVKSNATTNSMKWFVATKNGDFFKQYVGNGIHPDYEPTTVPQYAFEQGGNAATNKRYSDKLSQQACGKISDIENWKHFMLNNKLPLFINIVMTIDQHNNSLNFIPWLVDKQYSDEEINKMFGFTDEEIKLIDLTLKRFERNSPWFKRCLIGPKSVTDEEVNNFIQEINEEYVEG